ncbi:unnamed protein product, partial [Brachionus calyciflorus]
FSSHGYYKTTFFIDSNLSGCYHVDSTYKLIKNGFPLTVLGRTDIKHDFHPIAFCISSHEQEMDYNEFYAGLTNLANIQDIEFDPQYFLQDAWLASYNAITKIFDDVKLLMCYFHVILNCRKENRKLDGAIAQECKKHLKKMHFSINSQDMEKNYAEFRQFAKINCLNFFNYVKDQWLKGPFKRW